MSRLTNPIFPSERLGAVDTAFEETKLSKSSHKLFLPVAIFAQDVTDFFHPKDKNDPMLLKLAAVSRPIVRLGVPAFSHKG